MLTRLIVLDRNQQLRSVLELRRLARPLTSRNSMVVGFCFARRLSRKCGADQVPQAGTLGPPLLHSAGGCRANAEPTRFPRPVNRHDRKTARVFRPDLGCRGRQGVSVELQEVVSGSDQAPFRPNGRPAPAFEAPRASVLLDVGEHRLDHSLAPGVELLARRRLERPSHEVVGAAEARPSRSLAAVRIRGDEWVMPRSRRRSMCSFDQ